MSFRVIASGRRFAIDGELNAAVAREKAQLATSSSGGAPLATRSLELAKRTVDELLTTAPHDCDVAVDLWGERFADATGGVKIEVKITEHVAPPAPVAAEEEAPKTLAASAAEEEA